MMLRFCLLALLLLSNRIGNAQFSPSTNLAYRYSPNPEVSLSQLLFTDSLNRDVWEMEMRFRFSPALASPLLRIYSKPSYASSELTLLDTLRQQHLLLSSDSLRRFRYPFPDRSDSLYLLEVKLMRPDTSYWFLAERYSEYRFPLPKAAPAIPQSGTLLLPYSYFHQPLTILSSEAIAFFYDYSFSPAMPPMSARSSADSTLPAPKAIPINEREALPSSRGLYFIQADTSTLSGATVLRVPKAFPEINTVSDFSGPLRYLSTQQEWEELQADGFSKAAIDRFWLGASGEPELARVIIRQYYQRVAQANALFSSYKEGWKTDQGMIYILYGPPSTVHQFADKQIWKYSRPQYNSEISFTFARARNLFDPEHYVLVRHERYARPYYQIVNAWRKGE